MEKRCIRKYSAILLVFLAFQGFAQDQTAHMQQDFFKKLDHAAVGGIPPELKNVLPFCESLETASPVYILNMLPDITSGLNSVWSDVRQYAALAAVVISKRTDSYTTFNPYLTTAAAHLDDNDPSVRRALARTFTLVDPRLASKFDFLLEQRLPNAGEDVAPLYVRALARSSAKNPVAVQAIENFLEKSNSNLKLHSLVLQAIGVPGLESEPLLALLARGMQDDRTPDVRINAMRALARTGKLNINRYSEGIRNIQLDTSVPATYRKEAQQVLENGKRDR